MKSIVIFGSRHGNTKQLAEAIADGLRAHGPVTVVPVEKAPRVFDRTTDLVVIGGPTEAHSISEPVRAYLSGLSGSALMGIAAAAFDTRLDWPKWMSGSAGAGITGRLEKLGADVIVNQASFIVAGKDPVLKPGELDRAVAWGDTVGRALRAELAPA